MAAKKKTKPVKAVELERTYISQADVPSVSLEQALRIPQALAEHYAFRATSPLRIAGALGISPAAGPFKTLCGAAIAYGLTKGGYNAQEISLDDIGRRIVRPLTEDGDDRLARQQAMLKPRVVGAFLRQYDGARLPKEEIAKNVLHDLGVPLDRTARVFQLIVEGAELVGFLHDIKGAKYVEIPASVGGVGSSDIRQDDSEAEPNLGNVVPFKKTTEPKTEVDASEPRGATQSATQANRRVFITHGKNRNFLDAIKKLLAFGELEPVTSVERESVSIPVPEKVMNDMRSCGAAIIHVDDELRLVDPTGKEHVVLNPNVLIEIGAAMALYGRRFILLVKDGTTLPSNLQGLYEVRYKGDALDGEATMKMMAAIQDIKNHKLPQSNS